MNLNDQIANAEKFAPQASTEMPTVDRSANAAFGLQWASRNAEAAATAPAQEPVRSLGAMPIPN